MASVNAASAPGNGVLGIGITMSKGPLDKTVFDRLHVAVDPVNWKYQKAPIAAEHSTVNQLWDGPYNPPYDPGDWNFNGKNVPNNAKAAYDKLLRAANSPELRKVPADTGFSGVGDGEAMVSLHLPSPSTTFPGQKTWDNGATVPPLPSLNWTVKADGAPQPVQDVINAARELQSALKAQGTHPDQG